MLQQTRVAVVRDYYARFLGRFPTIEKLAAAREASVLAVWSGLGYYRRARMLHTAAKVIIQEHGGKFPRTAAAISDLPGIGRYTAAAIASIAWNEPVALVDGNVERVVKRMLRKASGGEDVWRSAQQLLDTRRPGDFNQAMMELGATICTPQSPRCAACPVARFCRARGHFPITAKKEIRQKKEIHYQLNRLAGSIFLIRRPPSASLMPGFWELPQLETPNGNQELFTVRHSITVTDYTVHVSEGSEKRDSGRWITRSKLATLPLTGLTRKILRRAEII